MKDLPRGPWCAGIGRDGCLDMKPVEPFIDDTGDQLVADLNANGPGLRIDNEVFDVAGDKPHDPFIVLVNQIAHPDHCTPT